MFDQCRSNWKKILSIRIRTTSKTPSQYLHISYATEHIGRSTKWFIINGAAGNKEGDRRVVPLRLGGGGRKGLKVLFLNRK